MTKPNDPNDPLARAFTRCNVCGRPLTSAQSVRFGVGPTCSLNIGIKKSWGEPVGALAQIPFDAKTGDVVCRRKPDVYTDGEGKKIACTRVATNISHIVIWHSPTGFEWGYTGNGPADFALNILNFYLPPDRAQKITSAAYDPLWYSLPIVLQRGGIVSQFASAFHKDFAARFLARLPQEGGTIKGDDIRAWISAKIGNENAAQGSLFDV